MKTIKKKKTTYSFNNLLILLVLISSIFLIYHILLLGPIEPTIRYIIIGFIILINFAFFIFKKGKSKKLAMFLMIVFLLVNIIGCYSINRVEEVYEKKKNKKEESN